MLTKSSVVKLKGLETFGFIFSYCLDGDSVLLLTADFDYYLIQVSGKNDQNSTIIKGKLKERPSISNTIPAYSLWFDYNPQLGIIYTSLADKQIKIFNLLEGKQTHEISLPKDLDLSSEYFDCHFVKFDKESDSIFAGYGVNNSIVLFSIKVDTRECKRLGSLTAAEDTSLEVKELVMAGAAA